MKNNNCTPFEGEKKPEIVITKTPCEEKAKKEWEDYLIREGCEKKEDPPFKLCDYDPNEVYFMQYRPKPKAL